MFIEEEEEEVSIVLETAAPLDVNKTSKESEQFVMASAPRVTGSDRYKFLFGISSGSFSSELSPSLRIKKTSI